jgi:hypothetical protein
MPRARFSPVGLVVSAMALVLTLVSSCAATGSAATGAAARETLFFDALATRAVIRGPADVDTVGHELIASGVLRDAADRPVGRFTSTCRTTKTLPGPEHLERCAGMGRTAQGHLAWAGDSSSTVALHTFATTRGTGAYRGARGTLALRDVGPRESIITVTLAPRKSVVLRVGVVARPPANAVFLRRTDRACGQAARALAALPPIPFPDFDPLHPDPGLLPQVGAFFTGPGDPRPTYRTLDARLRALGRPPANRRAWQHTVHARLTALAAINTQDRAALAGDQNAFVTSVRDNGIAFRRVAITATVFGAIRCVL